MDLRSTLSSLRFGPLLAVALSTFAAGCDGCSDDKAPAKPCPPGTAGCACGEADACDEGLSCEEDICRGAISRGVTIGDERARSCELLVTEAAGGHLLRATFDDSVRGTFIPERPRIAIAVTAKEDEPFAANAIQLLQAEGGGDVDLTKSTCFDGKGVALEDPKVTLSEAK